MHRPTDELSSQTRNKPGHLAYNYSYPASYASQPISM